MHLTPAKSTNAEDNGPGVQQKHYSELLLLWRRGCNEIELCLIDDFVSVFLKKLSSKVWKFRNNWTCRAGVINRMIVQEFSQLVTKQPGCNLQELHCVTNSSERKHSGKLTPYSRNTSVSELHCDITFKTLKRYWTACPLPGYQGFQAACVGWN